METYKQIYRFEILEKLLVGEVYILDRHCKKVYRASELSGGQLAKVALSQDTGNRYEVWIEEEKEEGKND